MKIFILPFLMLFCSIVSCKKSNDTTTKDCFVNSITLRTILNKQARVIKQGTAFYIIEQGTFDTKLNPCNLADEYKRENLIVSITGEVKATIQGGPNPCCTEDFYILKISK